MDGKCKPEAAHSSHPWRCAHARTPFYQTDDLDGGGVDDADVEAIDQHQGRGSGDAAVVEPARVRG